MDRIPAYMGDYTILTKLIYGPKIFLDTRDLSMTGHLILDGFWESWITKLFISIVKPGMTVLDLGANCGYYSLLAAYLVGTQGIVHSFEPNPFHHENFLKSKSINGYSQLHLHKVALGNNQGEITLYSPEKHTASASFNKGQIRTFIDDSITNVTVPMVNLLEYLPGLKADVIKMDIEGAEPLIMDSIFEIIQNSPNIKIIMEYNQSSWKIQGFDCENILNKFLNCGLHLNIIQHDSTLLPITSKELVKRANEVTHFDLYISKSNTSVRPIN